MAWSFALFQAGAQHSQSPLVADTWRWCNQHAPASSELLLNIAHFQKINELGATLKEPLSADSICMLSNTSR